MRLSRLAENVRCESTYGKISTPWEDLDEWQRNAHPYRVVLRYKRRQMSLDWFQGQALTRDPDSATVLSALISDSYAMDCSFDDWCSEYGYDTNSRRAERIFKQCQKQGEKLERLLGDDWEKFRGADNDV